MRIQRRLDGRGAWPRPAVTPRPARVVGGPPLDTVALIGDGLQVPAVSTTWTAGRPLSDAQNAHSTNTREDFSAALKAGYNWFEGDVRTEINPPYALEMRHDKGHESGDNLLLGEWLAAGKAAGKGLKLDVKEGRRIGDILEEVDAAGIPSYRLMFNLADGDMAKWAPVIRRRFPEAILAVNPAERLGRQRNSGPLQRWQVQRMIAHAQAGGDPVTFVVRYDRLTPEAILALSAHGTVSVWNDPGRGGVDDVERLTAQLRAQGVNGVIDLRPSRGVAESVAEVADAAKNRIRDVIGKIF